MNATQAEIGKKYLTRTGIPVTVIGMKDGKVSLKLATTGSIIQVNRQVKILTAKALRLMC